MRTGYTEGLWIRVCTTILAAAQAMIAAALGFGDQLADEWKFGLVVVSAGLAIVINQLPSWQGAPAAARALRRTDTKSGG